jgi:DNA-binding response OmpR family regulator
MRILIIEDDRDTSDYLKGRLQEHCFAVDCAYDGITGIQHAKSFDYDIILLDLDLPGKNGIAIAQELRGYDDEHKKDTPLIMISVTHDIDHKLSAFHEGFDDYLAKPFFFDELLARIQAVLRRPRITAVPQMTLDDLILNTHTQQVTRAGNSVYLTRKEFALLEYLMKHQGATVSRGALAEHVWDAGINPLSNTVEMHILNLRRKIEQGNKKRLIHSITGRGYKIDTQK